MSDSEGRAPARKRRRATSTKRPPKEAPPPAAPVVDAEAAAAEVAGSPEPAPGPDKANSVVAERGQDKAAAPEPRPSPARPTRAPRVTKLAPLPPPPELTRLSRKVVTQEVSTVSADAPAAEAPAATVAVLDEVHAARGLYELVWQSGLLTVVALARMEVSALFLTPLAYAVGALVVLLTSVYGYLPQVNTNAPVSTAGIFSLLALMAVFYVPLCTMRLAAQRRSGTLDHLLTSPIRFWEFVAGRWLGGLAFFAATISFSLIYVVLISADQKAHTPGSILGFHLSLPSVDYGSIFTGYLGVLLLGAAWVAIGLLIASLTENRIISAGAGILTLVALQYGFGVVSGLMTPPFSDLFDYLGAANRAQSFFEGQVALNDVVYFVTITLGALFITTRIVESRKWR